MKLPLWRLALAILVLGGMAAVLLSLSPVYYENYQLGQFVKQVARGPNTPDDTLRIAVLSRAHQLDLPVEPADVSVVHSEGKLRIQTNYKVQMDFPIYQVELHFHASGASR